MVIREYSKEYKPQVKDLLAELQEYISQLDSEKYNILTDEFADRYFEKTFEEVKQHNGKILLAEESGKITGLVAGIINESERSFYFCAPKRGRITELIVSERFRSQGTGKKLLEKMEEYFKNAGCKAVLLEVFCANKNARSFYLSEGYNERTAEMMKKI